MDQIDELDEVGGPASPPGADLSERSLRREGAVTTTVLALLVILVAVFSFCVGPARIDFFDLASALVSGHGTAAIIAREIRLPRALLAPFVGAALGASGAALQGLFRNPLAEPGVTGVTSCAGLGAVIALYFGFSNIIVLPIFAILGAMVAAGILYLLSRAGAALAALVLAGVAVASFATALTALALSLARNPYAMSEMVRWMLGSLKDSTPAEFLFAAPIIASGIAMLLMTARGLDALILGDEAAQSLGIDLHGVRRRVVAGVALATGAATAAAGAVSFVGLVVPHLLRRFYGYEPARLIWPSALGGAVLVTSADVGIRLISPDESLLLGVVTALIGAPFFVWLIVQLKGEE